jgi:hypothetical protein
MSEKKQLQFGSSGNNSCSHCCPENKLELRRLKSFNVPLSLRPYINKKTSPLTKLYLFPVFLSCGTADLFGSSPPIFKALQSQSQSHSHTPHSVGFLWMSDKPDAETTWQNTVLTRDRHWCSGEIRTRNPSMRETTAIRLTLRVHWDRTHTGGYSDKMMQQICFLQMCGLWINRMRACGRKAILWPQNARHRIDEFQLTKLKKKKNLMKRNNLFERT